MKTYWDYSEQERAGLTEDQVKSLLDVELMTKGIKRPEPPVLADIPKSPLGERQKFYSLSAKGKYGSDEHFNICFPSIETAQRFGELCPLRRDYDYEVGSEFEYVTPVGEYKLEVVELYGLDQINTFRSELKNRKAKSESNQKASQAFADASKKADEVTKHVWDDWYRQRQTLTAMASVVKTYNEYVTLTGGDIGLALTFLGKAHDSGTIQEAMEWFPNSIPDSAPPQVANAEPHPA